MTLIGPKHMAEKAFYLDPLSPDQQFDAYLMWLQDSEVTKFLEVGRNPPKTLEQLQKYVRSVADHETAFLTGIFTNDGDHIGNIKVELDAENSRAEIGLLLGEKEHWGQGIGTKAISMMSDYIISELKIRKILAGIYADNLGSIKAFQKAGYSQEARITKYWYRDGRYYDQLIYTRSR